MTPEEYAAVYLLHRHTYATEEELFEKRRRRLTSMFAAAMADARRAALETAIAKLTEFAGMAKTEPVLVACCNAVDVVRALLEPAPCSCTITRHERQENRACPVHFPAGAR